MGAVFGFLGLKFPDDAFYAAFGGHCVENGNPEMAPFCGLADMPRLLQESNLVPDPTSRPAIIAGQVMDMGLTEEPISVETVRQGLKGRRNSSLALLLIGKGHPFHTSPFNHSLLRGGCFHLSSVQ